MLRVIDRDGLIVIIEAHCDRCDGGWMRAHVTLDPDGVPGVGIDRLGRPMMWAGPPDLCWPCADSAQLDTSGSVARLRARIMAAMTP